MSKIARCDVCSKEAELHEVYSTIPREWLALYQGGSILKECCSVDCLGVALDELKRPAGGRDGTSDGSVSTGNESVAAPSAV